MRSRQKGGAILTTIAVIIVVLFIAAYVGPQIFIFYQMRNMRQKQPELMLVPHPMPNVPPAPVNPDRVSCYGYEFQTSWGKSEGSKDYEYFTTFDFPSGIQVSFSNPDKKTDVIAAMRAQNGAQVNSERIFGRHDINTRYDAQRAILEAVPPAEVSFFQNRERAVWSFMILLQKRSDVKLPTKEIFSFELGNWRGFQINNKSQDEISFKVHAFDKDDGHLEFEVSQYGKLRAPVTQAEINAVLLSVRPNSAIIAPPKKKEK